MVRALNIALGTLLLVTLGLNLSLRALRDNASEPNPNVADSGALNLTNPFSAADGAALERGAVVFRGFCVPCHGPEGAGDGIIVEHGFPRPPILLRTQTQQMTDAQVFRIVTNGIGAMASHAQQMSRDDRWKAILHLRRLQQRATAAAPAQDAR